MRYARFAVVLAVVLGLLALGGSALAGTTVTIQNGTEYAPGLTYTGTDDTYTQVTGRGPWSNAGPYRLLGPTNQHSKGSMLVRFAGLDTALGGLGVTNKTEVLSATFKFYATASYSGGTAGYNVWRMTHTWNEGTSMWGAGDQGSFGDYDNISGCNNAAYTAPRLGSALVWTQDPTYSNVYYATVTSKAAGYSRQPTYHDGFCTERADVATVAANANSFYSTATTLYVNTANYKTTSRYWLTEDLWSVPGMLYNSGYGSYFGNSPGLNDCYDSTDLRTMPEPAGAGSWIQLDVTSWVQDWYENDPANCGMLLRNNAGDYKGWYFASSEYGTSTLRPMLEITYELPPAGTVPEPAGLSLLGLALAALRRRRS